MTYGCKQVIDVVSRVTPRISAPIIMFTYYNPIMRRGQEKFCRDIRAAGAAGETNAPKLALILTT